MSTPSSKKQDNRKPNFQPNHLPNAIAVGIELNGSELATIGIPQRDKLSEAGNVTFGGGLTKRAGWQLPGASVDALNALSFTVTPANVDEDGNISRLGDTVAMAKAASGVHKSENDNDTVCHMATIALPSSTGDPVKYTVQVYATNVDDAYALSVSGFLKATPQASQPIKGVLVSTGNLVLDPG